MPRPRPSRVLLHACTIATATALAAGCARVTVRKVPTPTQYSHQGVSSWTHDLQLKADAMEGVRFYLPRPFVSVFESFPIATDLYLAKGRVSADNKYVVIDSITPLSTRGDFANGAIRELAGTAVPKSLIFRRTATPGPAPSDPQPPATPRSGDDPASPAGDSAAARLLEEAKAAAASAGAAAADAKAAAAQAQNPAPAPANGTTEGSQTGISRRKVTNSNGAFAFTPLRGNFDVLYLPDFDEQYVVSSKSRLGNASFELNLGQGWSLQGFNSLTDNSELNKRIFDLIDTASDLAKKAATAGLGSVLPTTALGSLADTLASPRSGDEMEESPGTPVALKIVVVHYAAKGLYPVIKPRELADKTVPGLVVDLQQRGETGTIRLPSPEEVQAAVERLDTHQRRFTVPVYPYQYISFNTFRYLAIQVLTPEGSTAGDLYDKTGTAGEPGDRQAFDASEIMKKLLNALATGTPQPKDDSQTQTQTQTQAQAQAQAAAAAVLGEAPLRADALAAVKTTVPSAQNVTFQLGRVTDDTRIVQALIRLADGAPAPTPAQMTTIEDSLKRLLNEFSGGRVKTGLGGEVTGVQAMVPDPN